MNTELTNPIDAFHMACELAISATTQEKSDMATKLAEEFAMMLTPEQVEAVKKSIEGAMA